MISPIQQNIFFKGVEKAKSNDQFTGYMPAAANVRGEYREAINDVVSVQQNMQAITSDKLGGNLNTIA